MSQTSDSLPELHSQSVLCLVIFLLRGKMACLFSKAPLHVLQLKHAQQQRRRDCKTHLFPFSFYWALFGLCQEAGQVTMTFHRLCALPHLGYKPQSRCNPTTLRRVSYGALKSPNENWRPPLSNHICDSLSSLFFFF